MVHGHLGCQSGLVIGLFVPRCTKYSSLIGCVPCTSYLTLYLELLHLLAVFWQGADSNHGATPRSEPIRSFEILCQGLYFLCSFACLINGLSKPVNISIIVSN